MPGLEYLTFQQYIATIVAAFNKHLQGIDPTIHLSWNKAFTDGMAAASIAVQGKVQDLEKQIFPQTAGGEYLARWGAWENLPRNLASPGSGLISQQGTIGTVIPIGTKYRGSNGIIYSTDQVSTIVANNESVTSITRVGNIATATTENAHNLGAGQVVVMSGADQAEYNGTVGVTILARDKFSYEVPGAPLTPATGTIEVDYESAIISITADDAGLTTNLDSGASINIDGAPILGITVAAIVTYDAITGGASDETDDAYRSRITLSRSIIEGIFTKPQIQLAALGITGNTRAFVVSPEQSVCSLSPTFPVPGQVAVYILRDNDPSILPSQQILDLTKQAVIDNGKMPAQTVTSDIFVLAPVLVEVDFDFTQLSPDNPTMRSAVAETIRAFFEDSVDFATTVQADSYRGAIQNTQDLATGGFLSSFALSAPTGNIVVGTGEIASLRDVTFSI